MLKIPIRQQLFITLVIVLIVSLSLFGIKEHIGYYVVALILLLLVSILAMLFERIPVLLAAILSALTWNFFFIPPIYTFHIDKTEDVLLFLMYFVIALVNAVLTYEIRKQEQKTRDKEEKEKAILLYNTLLNSLSHELRTPIATIIGAVDTLQENKLNLTDSTQKELLLEIDKASLRLNRQVENLLNMSRLETGILKIHRDWCDINEIVSIVLNKLVNVTNHHIFVFVPNENLPLYKLDVALMEEIIYNILHNALQYTPHNTAITIATEDRPELCYLTISDNGLGFPESEIALAFDKFYRLPQSKTGGTGLGLSIVKGFVEAHNGKVSLVNLPKGGAKFTIEIPTETTYMNQLKNE